MNYKAFITSVLNEASHIANEKFGKVAGTTKPGESKQVLTEADLVIGKLIVERIKKEYPDYNVIDEEAGVIDNDSEFTWVVDPIEATSNFAAGLPQYGIMIGLLENDKPIAGGIIVPAYKKLYLAEKEKGATCNGMLMHVTNEKDLNNVLIAFSADGHPEDPERTRRDYACLAEIALAARNTRNNNCEAVDTMYVAEGRYGGRINLASKIWDNVAPQIIIEEAGGVYTDFSGKPIDYSKPLTKAKQNFTMCAASPVLHKQLQDIIHG